MFGISGFELLIICALILIIFGPDKLPELGRTVGRAMGMFKRAQEDMERVIRSEMYTSDTKAAADKREAQSVAADTTGTAAKATPAATIWASTDEGDEEEDEE
ncbi:MAG: twin-arginine translocase TatA/TatE family subunit [Coriobacteriia bacterium]|nr:twin-arginine translocase TatA/TatE family subunit [Coriobacteriia bacterium]